jgi:hypothetical protein
MGLTGGRFGETYRPDYECLTWTENRWHLAGQGIHAGTMLEIHDVEEGWVRVRLESRHGGRILIVCVHVLGRVAQLDLEEHDLLRWPSVAG